MTTKSILADTAVYVEWEIKEITSPEGVKEELLIKWLVEQDTDKRHPYLECEYCHQWYKYRPQGSRFWPKEQREKYTYLVKHFCPQCIRWDRKDKCWKGPETFLDMKKVLKVVMPHSYRNFFPSPQDRLPEDARMRGANEPSEGTVREAAPVDTPNGALADQAVD